MTVVAPGTQLAPVDLPPPRPSADPREPSPMTHTRTPQRHRSPRASRSSSPNPAALGDASPPPLLHPRPRPTSTSAATSPGAASPASLPAVQALGHPAHALLSASRPGSPSSIHSSGSAIFERDIELPAVASLSLAGPQTLNHKPSRMLHHGSALEHSVPAVLDDAVEALADEQARPLDSLEIEAPAPAAAAVAMARQSSSSLPTHKPGSPERSLSRSSSPASAFSGSFLASPRSPPILGQLALQQAVAAAHDGPASPTRAGATRPPMAARASTGPQLPGGWVREAPGEEEAIVPSPAVPSHLTPTKEKRRISFISYNDLLLSVPTTVTSLGEIAAGNLSPDHLPGTVSPGGVASRSPVQPSSGDGSVVSKPSWETVGRGGLGFAEDEWEREGLGRGLEQRLEDLVQHGA